MFLAYPRFDLNLMSVPSDVLIEDFKRHLIGERKTLSQTLAFIQEIDHRELYLAEGYSHLSKYLQEEVGFSEDEAMKRIQAARLARRFPYTYELIENGQVSLTVLCRLSPHLTNDNHEWLLDVVKGKSVRIVEKILACHFPKAERPDYVRKSALPLAVDRYSIRFTTNEEGVDLLEKAKALLSDKYPDGKLTDIYNEALKLLIHNLEPKNVESRAEAPSPVPGQVRETQSVLEMGAEGPSRSGSSKTM